MHAQATRLRHVETKIFCEQPTFFPVPTKGFAIGINVGGVTETLENMPDLFCFVRSGKQGTRVDNLHGHTCEGPDVNWLSVVTQSQQDLGCPVPSGGHVRGEVFLVAEVTCKTVVTQLDHVEVFFPLDRHVVGVAIVLHCRSDQDVLRLHVPVEITLGVDMTNAVQELGEH